MPASNKNTHGLGRSFASLIPVDLLDESFDPTADQDQQISELRNIKMSEIKVDPDQPRKNFNEEDLLELSASISTHGVMQPIIVTPAKDGYQIVAGERRYRASVMAGLDKIPALVRTLSGQHKLEISLIENLQRKDLNAMEVATAYQKLRDQFNLSLEQIGRQVGGKSVAAISNTLRLLKLPGLVRAYLADGRLTEGQARPLIGLDEAVTREVVPRIIKEGWSARRIEQFIVDFKKNSGNSSLTGAKKINQQSYVRQIDSLKKYLKTEIKIRSNTKGSGQIVIKFRDEEEFERINKMISKS